MIMSGNLQFINSQMLFQYLENNRKTVTFRVRHGEWNRNFYFEEGKIVWVSSESPDELLGDWLVRAGLVTGEQMRQFLQDSLAAGEQFTSYLMDVGCLCQEKLEDAVAQLARFVVFRIFRNNVGEFQIFPGIPQDVMAGRIRLSPRFLVLEFGQTPEESAGGAAPEAPPPVPAEPALVPALRRTLLADAPAREKFVFEVLPETALQLYRKMRSPSVSGAEIARMVMTSPELSAQILQLANSPLMGINRQVDSLPQAVALLGFERISNLVIALSFRCLRRSTRFTHLRRRHQKLSVVTALTAHDLAFVLGRDVEEFFLLGLLYRVGSIMALDLLEKRMPSAEIEKLETDPELDPALHLLEPEFLAVWGKSSGLPPQLLEQLGRLAGRNSAEPEALLLEKAFLLAKGLALEDPVPEIDDLMESANIQALEGFGPAERESLRQLLKASLDFSKALPRPA